MPYLIPGHGEITVRFRNVQGHVCASVFGVEMSATPTQAQVDTLSTSLGAQYKAVLSTGGGFDGIRLLIGTSGLFPDQMTSSAGAGAGTVSAAVASPQVQALIRKTTSQAARQGVGRTFLPDVQEARISDVGLLNAAAMTQYGDFATNVYAALNVAPFAGMELLHPEPIVPTNVTAYQAQTLVATLRPRYSR